MTGRTYYSEEAKQAAKYRQIALGLSALVTGVGIGATVAMLFAPDDGEHMRAKISEALEDSVNRSQDKFTEVIQSIESEYPDVADRIRDAVDGLNEKAPRIGS